MLCNGHPKCNTFKIGPLIFTQNLLFLPSFLSRLMAMPSFYLFRPETLELHLPLSFSHTSYQCISKTCLYFQNIPRVQSFLPIATTIIISCRKYQRRLPLVSWLQFLCPSFYCLHSGSPLTSSCSFDHPLDPGMTPPAAQSVSKGQTWGKKYLGLKIGLEQEFPE